MPKVVARVRRRKMAQKCFFCTQGKTPTYKEHEVLADFLTPRGKILGKDRSGVCAKHQRRLSREIKRAREAALL